MLLTMAAGCAAFLGAWTDASYARGLCSAIAVLAMPCIMYLTGVVLRRTGCREKLRLGAGFFVLYGAEKLISFWVAFAALSKPEFSVLQADAFSWPFLVLGMVLCFASRAEEKGWHRGKTLAVLTLACVILPYIKPFGTYLGLSYLFAFAPLVLLGLWEQMSWRERLLKNRLLPLLALILCAGVVGACLLRPDAFWILRTFFMGSCSYPRVSSSMVHTLGGGLRIAHYLLVYLVANGLLRLIPDRHIPFVTSYGKRWYAAWFWFSPILILMECLLLDKLAAMGSIGMVLTAALVAVLLLAAGTGWAMRPVLSLLNWHRLLERPPRRLEPGASFFRRHKGAFLYIVLYTGTFLLSGIGAAYALVAADKSLVWDVDGLQQQYTSLLFFRNYVLDVIESTKAAGHLVLPQFTFTGGQGMAVLDVIRKDPFAFFSLLTDETHMEAMFAFLVFFRLWVSGLLFSWLCWEMNQKGSAQRICGALVYVFSGYSICVMVRQTSFLHTCLVNLPLILVGVERYLRKGKGGVFLFAIFLGSFNGYYATWMNSLMMAIWLLIRLIDTYGTDIKGIVSRILKMIGLYLWGLCLAMVVFLPAVMTLLYSGRGGEASGYSGSMFYYGANYYQTLLTTLFGGYKPVGYWTITGAAGVALLAAVLLFLRKDRTLRALKAGLIVSVIGLCIPLIGKIFNGFGYVSNRWCYGFALVLGLVVCWMLPEFFRLTEREVRTLILVTIIYSAIVLMGKGNDDIRRIYALAMIMATLLVILTLGTTGWNARQKQAALSVVVSLSLVGNLAFALLPEFGDYLSLCLPAGTVQDKLESSAVTVANQIEDEEGFYRIEQPQLRSNQATALDYYGTSSYFSIVSGDMSDYYNAFTLCSVVQSFDLHGLDSRAALEALGSVKYYLCKDGKTGHVPYGFEQVDTITKNDTDYAVFENTNFLSAGYTYTGVMTRSDFDALTPLERQQAILQYAVVEDEDASKLDGLTFGTPVTEMTRREVTVEDADGVAIDFDAKTISVTSPSSGTEASVTLRFAGTPECETYLYLQGLEYADEKSGNTLHLRCKSQGLSCTTYIHGKQHTYFFDREGVSYNLGYDSDGVTTCQLFFNQPCELTFEDIGVYALPVARFQQDVDALKTCQLENVVEHGDSVTGTISCDSRQLLATSVPYSRGWHMYVDGEEAALLQTNVMYCGAVLEAGDHTVELKYVTPGISSGAAISIAAFALLIGWKGGMALIRRKQTSK